MAKRYEEHITVTETDAYCWYASGCGICLLWSVPIHSGDTAITFNGIL